MSDDRSQLYELCVWTPSGGEALPVILATTDTDAVADVIDCLNSDYGEWPDWIRATLTRHLPGGPKVILDVDRHPVTPKQPQRSTPPTGTAP